MNFREAKKLFNPLNIIQIGITNKPHGYKGQIKINLFFDAFNLKEESVLIKINGWLIPFFIDYKQTNLEATKPIIKFEDIVTIEQAKKISSKPVYLPRNSAKKYVNLNSLQFLLGYQIIDVTSKTKGYILKFINNDKNPLVKITLNNKELFIPIRGTKIKYISHGKKYVKVELAPGIITHKN